jgi:signal transduction histidine kinase
VALPRAQGRYLRVAVAALAVANGLGALAVARGAGQYTTYAGAWRVAAAIGVAAGLALVAAGLAESLTLPARLPGDLALAAGVVWFAPFWDGWEGGPRLVRSLGTVAACFVFPLLVHLVLAFPTGRVVSLAGRVLVVAAYAEATVSALVRALFRDPFLDPDAWSNYTATVFLVHAAPRLAHHTAVVDRWFAIAASAVLAVLCVRALVTASGPNRAMLAPVLGPGVLLAAAVTAHAVALERTPVEDPRAATFRTLFLLGSAAVIALAAGLEWTVVRAHARRRAVGAIVADLGEAPPPGSVEAALAHALGDPALRIAYWLDAPQRLADAHGRAVEEPLPSAGRTVTPLAHDGRTVALVAHATSVAELERELGAAIRLALENERLRAEVLAQLDDLRASRTRIVETGDERRRQLEHDLHDGAQQRLLALSYDIRLALADADRNGDAAAAALLVTAVDEAAAALDELRELAHGIYPAVLVEGGLAPAVATFAETALLPVELDVADVRYPASVEAAAYVVVTEAVDDASRRRATYAAVAAARQDGHLVVRVRDNGTKRTSPMVYVNDRIGALGGRVEFEPRALTAEIPCA